MSNVTLEWSEGHRFEGRSPGGSLSIDGDGEAGPSPVSLLLQAVGACAGIDVVDILRKGRQELRGLRVEVAGVRREEPPRRFTHLSVTFRVEGPVDRKAAERAARLSFDKYCSVFHTLRKDLELEWRVVLE